MQLPGWLITVFYFFAALYPLVLVHELGHFTVAKLNKIRVDEFGLGFPPRIVKLFSAGGTDYTLNWLPLGGFVRLHGEDDPTVPGAFAAARPRSRAAVLLAGPFANFALTVVILAAVGAFWGVEQAVRAHDVVRIAGVEDGSPAAAAGLQPGDLVVAIDGRALAEYAASAVPMGELLEPGTELPVTAVDGMIQATADSAGRALRLSVVRGTGDAIEVDATEGTGLGGVWPSFAARPIETVGSPARGAALQANDLILAPLDVANGSREPRPGEALVALRAVGGAAPEVMDIMVTPAGDAATGRAKMGVAIGSVAYQAPLTWWKAPWYGVTGTVDMLKMMVTGLARMVSGTDEVQLAGPVGIARLSRQAGESGLMTLLRFAAILSANLGLINLFPIPGLDGGRLLFVAAEVVRGARVEPTREALVNALGIGFVLLLMLAITVMEVLNPVSFAQP
ncbi:MAG: site-2 protease family protein [Ardenticatenales bacterium]|jgi:regulator of sigma E protease|nr:site-2 protease family protein [Ardenticatenales bacterium]